MKKIFLLLFFITLNSFAQDKDFVLGKITTIHSTELNEDRILNIYLPEGYNSNESYPVIYLLDGSANEDFIHIVGLVQFANFEWVKLLPKSIVVGIENVDRKRDFTYPTTIEKDKRIIQQQEVRQNSLHLLKKNYSHLSKINTKLRLLKP